MQQLTLTAVKELRWLDVPPPTITEPHQALVRPIAVSLCDIDPLLVSGAFPVPLPVALGHEFVADVVSIGAQVGSLEVGMRVLAPYQVSCGKCSACRDGRTGHCQHGHGRALFGFGAFGGGHGGALSDLVCVPWADHMLLEAPRVGDPAALAAASDNMPDGWRAVAPGLDRFPGAEVLIVAERGSIPLYAAGLALVLGAARVLYLSNAQDDLTIAAALGAEPMAGPWPREAGSFPVTVSASWDPAALSCALRSTASGGVCTNLVPMGKASIPVLTMFERDVTLVTGRGHPRVALPPLLDLIARGQFDPGPLTRVRGKWEQAADLLLEHRGKAAVVRD